jgi:hypothetical protein
MLGRIEPGLLLCLKCNIGPRLMGMTCEEDSLRYAEARVMLCNVFGIDHVCFIFLEKRSKHVILSDAQRREGPAFLTIQNEWPKGQGMLVGLAS